MTHVKLFCFPYAGGSAMVYKKWRPYLHPDVELIPVELAGRGQRISEPFYRSLEEVVNEVYGVLEKQIHEDSPYAIFGHSMGSMIAYQLTQKIRKNRDMLMPLHVFFSGRGAPHVVRSDQKKYSKMPLDEFKKEVLDLGGTMPEFFDYPDLLEIFLPLLKNDFYLAETTLCQADEVNPLPIDISILAGKEEDLTPEQVVEWKKHTRSKCTVHYLEGGHFFVNTQTEAVVQIIHDVLGMKSSAENKFQVRSKLAI